MLDEGIVHLKDIPGEADLNEKHRIQVQSYRTKRAHIEPESIRKFLSQLNYPLYYLDFETFMTAVPMYDGVRPYEQIPFQFSLHIVREPGAKPEHHGYLAEGDVDPRPEILRLLKHLLGTKGSIVAYNAGFEKARLREMLESVNRHDAMGMERWYDGIDERFVDLLQPFREFAYYHPSQRGSESMKAVLGPLTGRDYADLEIADGGLASLEYLRVTFGEPSNAKGEKEKVRRQLEEYCGRDTEGMIWIVEALSRIR
jgi:hypothetical protein